TANINQVCSNISKGNSIIKPVGTRAVGARAINSSHSNITTENFFILICFRRKNWLPLTWLGIRVYRELKKPQGHHRCTLNLLRGISLVDGF
ncbi:MAG: hypothetical protein ACJ700_00905, partial [Nitrososphaera sp.]